MSRDIAAFDLRVLGNGIAEAMTKVALITAVSAMRRTMHGMIFSQLDAIRTTPQFQ